MYDVSTIAILWFAGASAMAGMLTLIPCYGMAPEWASAIGPLGLVLTGAAFLITWIFNTSVDAQGGAYATAERFVRDCARRTIRLVANEPDGRDPQEYADKERQIRRDHDLPSDEDLIFVEVTVTDPSEFENAQEVHGTVMHGRYRVLALESSSVPKALAALAKFLLFGVGEIAPTTREVLRRAEPDRQRRPHVHVG